MSVGLFNVRAHQQCEPQVCSTSARRRYTGVAAAVVSLVALGLNLSISNFAAAQAIPPTVLKLADSLPTSDLMSRAGSQYWMEQVKKLSNGAITFKFFPSQQLGKAADLLNLAQSGVTDIAFVAPSYVSNRMPLSDVAALPGMYVKACVGTNAYWKLAKDGILAKEEFAANNVKALFAFAYDPYAVISTNRPLTKFDDFKGLKLKTAGGSLDLAMRELGAIPIQMAGPDVYEAERRGTIDGQLGHYTSLPAYGTDKLAKYATVDASFGSFVAAWVIREKTWNALPPSVAKVLQTAGEATVKNLCETADREDEAEQVTLEKQGVKFWKFTDADRAELSKRFSGVSGTWAKSMDDRKKPGSQVLVEFKKALQPASQ